EQAETKRLFYVALTRARDHLVLSGEGKGEWRRWIEEHAACGTGIRMVTAVPLAAAAESARATEVAVLPEEVLRRVLAPLPLPRGMDLSVTGLTQLEHCPRKFYYKEILGLDEGLFAELLQQGSARGAVQELSAVEKGTLAHALLEQLDFSLPEPELLLRGEDILRRRGLAESREAEGVLREVAAFICSPLGGELAASRLLRESPFVLLLRGEGEYRVKGAIDLVAERPGEVAVYDYKYVRGEMPEAYRLQVMIYMLAVSRAFPGRRVQGWLVPLRGGEPQRVVPGDLAVLEGRLTVMLDRARGLRGEGEFPLREACDGQCPFSRRCFPAPPGSHVPGRRHPR
ncbi:MAG TPA: PD-(D/E)XK nuclease family protein, partial [Verrucomicrobiae bacterium]|nr:PD-(D/E)XK nuclease family protein [Verrucomicrobiae bacterium]